MMKSLFARKIGMTRIYTDEGQEIPVTILKAEPNKVVSSRTLENGKTKALIGFGNVKEKNVGKAHIGQFKKAGIETFAKLKEVVFEDAAPEIGTSLSVAAFEGSLKVDVISKSKGRGFAGTIKRHGFSRGPMTHGSHNKRAPGSIGAHSYPARVFPGQKLPGHYGDARVTTKNLKLVKIDAENHLLYLKGAVPGAINAQVEVRKV
jgi:large subunit ribosomal protein L3